MNDGVDSSWYNTEKMTFSFDSKFVRENVLEATNANGTNLTDNIVDASYICVSIYLITIIIVGTFLNTKALILLNQVNRVSIHEILGP